MKIGGSYMEAQAGIPSSLVIIIQSIIIFFMAAEEGILHTFQAWRACKSAPLTLEKGG